ncbi:tetratricopeptide repeat protein [Rhizorhabdus dicambivorans]|uniref:Cytochrome C biogenesis protein n=1 Tax=Rhizorhabdus dicambivorans TaxID=1850238 RepID=A0A2A4G0F8_9SPHN|nr:cytochrome C biogenesis protein [Rhizorhabdus dicambivorans]ATE66568.1 cytochrome C biogenesis protein [Rhizorhabdus dicambivorans]PCE43948.1 cytochrome C biogenesis protein [Rhizorhabdus dicambivorans]
MTGWLIFLGMALIVAAALYRFGRLPRGGVELVAAALLLGVAGYAWQGSPGLSGKPTPPPEASKVPDSAFLHQDDKMLAKVGTDADVMRSAEGLQSQGLNLYAIAIIKAGLAKRPNSPDLWAGLGNAMVIHDGGQMSPAAQLAFQRAEAIAPDHPAPPFFMGLAYAQAGQFDRAEATWRALLDRSPANAPWRPELEQRLIELERLKGQAAQ